MNQSTMEHIGSVEQTSDDQGAACNAGFGSTGPGGSVLMCDQREHGIAPDDLAEIQKEAAKLKQTYQAMSLLAKALGRFLLGHPVRTDRELDGSVRSFSTITSLVNVNGKRHYIIYNYPGSKWHRRTDTWCRKRWGEKALKATEDSWITTFPRRSLLPVHTLDDRTVVLPFFPNIGLVDLLERFDEGKFRAAYAWGQKYRSLDEKTRLVSLFARACRELHDKGLAHGELVPANAGVTSNERILIFDPETPYLPGVLCTEQKSRDLFSLAVSCCGALYRSHRLPDYSEVIRVIFHEYGDEDVVEDLKKNLCNELSVWKTILLFLPYWQFRKRLTVTGRKQYNRVLRDMRDHSSEKRTEQPRTAKGTELKKHADYVRAFEEHLMRRGTSRALLVSGRWGSGKTWFVSEIAAKALANKYDFRFVSLFGISEPKELSDIVRTKCYPALSQVRTIVGAIGLAALCTFFPRVPDVAGRVAGLEGWPQVAANLSAVVVPIACIGIVGLSTYASPSSRIERWVLALLGLATAGAALVMGLKGSAWLGVAAVALGALFSFVDVWLYDYRLTRFGSKGPTFGRGYLVMPRQGSFFTFGSLLFMSIAIAALSRWTTATAFLFGGVVCVLAFYVGYNFVFGGVVMKDRLWGRAWLGTLFGIVAGAVLGSIVWHTYDTMWFGCLTFWCVVLGVLFALCDYRFRNGPAVASARKIYRFLEDLSSLLWSRRFFFGTVAVLGTSLLYCYVWPRWDLPDKWLVGVSSLTLYYGASYAWRAWTKTRVIVFDDFERCSIEMGTLLGLVDGYSSADSRTMILADESRIRGDSAYRTMKERVIRQTVSFSQDPQEVVLSVIATYVRGGHNRELLLAYIDRVVAWFEETCEDGTNIRMLIEKLDHLRGPLKPETIMKAFETRREV